MKAATRCGLKKRGEADISIHAAREGGDDIQIFAVYRIRISIHAAREGGDLLCLPVFLFLQQFQSTPPVKAATSSKGKLESSFLDFNPRRP